MKGNGAYRLFCGFGIIEKWQAPDHTKIEEFRSRVFQLARIKGNFLFVLESTSLRMNDKHSLVSLLDEHQIGLQAPSNIKSKKLLPTKEIQDELKDRRAGIEPLIGHAKLAEGHPEAMAHCRMELAI